MKRDGIPVLRGKQSKFIFIQMKEFVNQNRFKIQGFRIINSVKKNSSPHGINNGKIFLGWNNDITRII